MVNGGCAWFAGQTYQNGLSTPLQGALQTTGSYWSSGVSVFSFRGVYRAPMGTTRREASCSSGQRSVTSALAGVSYHARAGKRVPTEADAISVLDIAPLILQCLKVGHVVLRSPSCVEWEVGGIVDAHSSNWRGGEGRRKSRRGSRQVIVKALR
jgi:hypothetical protein